ncbi:helix-turn-helix transcriptional regulator [Wukongibacter sp. M2B1]|uniref:helix-turn-helix transcriptional regulator n=1 Tax=Wukongibacter sp. M2B1 TaxID=3088895 RepID=UPI003D79DBE4
MKKTERLNAIIMALSKYKRLTAKDLSEMLEINIRTIYRDIDALGQMQVPIVSYYGKDGGYELLDDYWLPSVSFTEEEILSLILAHKLINQLNMPGFSKYLQSATLKIENIMVSSLKKEVSNIQERIHFDIMNIAPIIGSDKWFDVLRDSFHSDRCIRILYFTPAALKITTRIVEPHVLLFIKGAWYLKGYCRMRKAIRTFRLDRIKSIELTDEIFILDRKLIKNDYTEIGAYELDAKSKRSEKVVMNIDRPLYERLKYDKYLKFAKIDKDGPIMQISVKATYFGDYIELALRNPGSIQILSPKHLINDIKQKVEILKENYL